MRTNSLRDWCSARTRSGWRLVEPLPRSDAAARPAWRFLLLTPSRPRALARSRDCGSPLPFRLLGLIPVSDLQRARMAGSRCGFQLVERNPWSFHADGLLQPIEQAIVCTPLFYLLLLWTTWACARRVPDGAPWDVLGDSGSAVPIVAWFVLGCFADDTRLRLHWPMQGYLPLLIGCSAACSPRPPSVRMRGGAVSLTAAFALLATGCCPDLGLLSRCCECPAAPGRWQGSRRFRSIGSAGMNPPRKPVDCSNGCGSRMPRSSRTISCLPPSSILPRRRAPGVCAGSSAQHRATDRTPQLALWQRRNGAGSSGSRARCCWRSSQPRAASASARPGWHRSVRAWMRRTRRSPRALRGSQAIPVPQCRWAALSGRIHLQVGDGRRLPAIR